MSVTIREGDPRTPAVRALLNASHALMQALFPPEDNFYLEIDALCVPSITFLVAEVDGAVCGCGAIARKDGYAEIKSMYVDEAARGKGVAAALLDALETRARGDGIGVLRLETGNLLHSALRLYERHGFVRIGPFGDYPDSPSSLFYEKRLV
ncbi:MAG: GNAT family N-acetyltransferase [Roseivivax sp.]|nr:GNAT family N-acetyltransferase [Roseivivax sp.]